MDSLIKSKRDLIEVKNGFFKYTLTGLYHENSRIDAGHNCLWRFTIPPLNEMGFSDKYNQCLMKFNHIYLSGRSGHGIQGGNNDGGENGVWYDTAGDTKTGTGGLILSTTIPCRNQLHLETTRINPHAGTTKTGPTIHRNRFQQVISNVPKHIAIQRSTDVDTNLDVEGGAYYLQNGTIGLGGIQVADSTAPANVASGGIACCNVMNVWSYENHNDIFTDGVLCAVPFGQEITFHVINAENGETLCLSSQTDNADGTGTYLEAEIVIQLLPNP